jgi:hypothetical protein
MNYKAINIKEIENKSRNILELKNSFDQITKQDKDEYENIQSALKLILEGQRVNQKDIRLGFIGLAKQNNELMDLNKKLNRKLDATLEELYILKKERE